MIRVGGHEGLRLDFEIPGRHGVRQTMADTLGIGSIFRALCTIPALLELARELHEVAPGAWLYNYTNPMAALVWAIYAGTAHQRVVGVCMSPENTAQQLAELAGVPFGEIAYLAGGMNHQSWILRLEHDGQDLYPRLRQIVADDPGRARTARPRGDAQAVRLLSRPSRASTARTSCPGSFPHEDQVRRFRIPVNEYLHRSERQPRLLRGDPAQARGGGAARARTRPRVRPTDHPLDRDGDAADGLRQRPQRRLDRQPAGGLLHRSADAWWTGRGSSRPAWGACRRSSPRSNRLYLNVCELTVRAALEERRDLVYQAALLDPSTAATLSIDEIVHVCDELIDAHGDLIPHGIRAS
jgi:alpha-galactosidase